MAASGDFDAIVLGVGAMGAAVCRELAGRGRRVLGLEQFDFVHDRGSSHGETRVIRQAYFEHPDYVPLLRRAYDGWDELAAERREELFVRCGCLSLGPPEGVLAAGVRRAAAEHGLPIENLAAADARARYPAWRIPDSWVGVLERNAGYLHVERCVAAMVASAQARGADLRPRTEVRAWRRCGAGVEVETMAGEKFRAAKLAIAAGAWAGRTLAELRLPLEIRRKALVWFAAPRPELFRAEAFPVYLADTAAGFHYGFPTLDGATHKTSRHCGGEPLADPDALARDFQPHDADDSRAFVREHLPTGAGRTARGAICMYTMTPDEDFVVDLHPHLPDVALAAGFSGHGFKFAPAIGAAVADLLEHGRSALPLGRFRADRFAPSASPGL